MLSSISGLTEKQYNKIVKYWSKIEKLENRIDYYGCYIKRINDGDPWLYNDFFDTEDIDDAIDHLEKAKKVLEQYDCLKNELKYLKSEYKNYINELGYQFSDRNQDEKLFQLINNGILI
jgi:hypothetical protein